MALKVMEFLISYCFGCYSKKLDPLLNTLYIMRSCQRVKVTNFSGCFIINTAINYMILVKRSRYFASLNAEEENFNNLKAKS